MGAEVLHQAPRGPGRGPDDPDDRLVDLMVVPLWQSELIRDVLDEAGIDCEVVEAMSTLTWSLTDARIRVRRRDRDAASKALAKALAD